jgi:CRP-like cAMP-binding protein
MSPAGQPSGSPRKGKIARQTSTSPAFQTERKTVDPSAKAKKGRDFDPQAFLATIGEGRKSVLFQKKQGIFAQGDTADAVFYIQTGKVKTHRGLEDWQGSNDRHIGEETFSAKVRLRAKLSAWALQPQ